MSPVRSAGEIHSLIMISVIVLDEKVSLISELAFIAILVLRERRKVSGTTLLNWYLLLSAELEASILLSLPKCPPVTLSQRY